MIIINGNNIDCLIKKLKTGEKKKGDLYKIENAYMQGLMYSIEKGLHNVFYYRGDQETMEKELFKKREEFFGYDTKKEKERFEKEDRKKKMDFGKEQIKIHNKYKNERKVIWKEMSDYLKEIEKDLVNMDEDVEYSFAFNVVG